MVCHYKFFSCCSVITNVLHNQQLNMSFLGLDG